MKIEIDINYCPPDERSAGGWCWSVYQNGQQYASEILPEPSRTMAEAFALRYAAKLLGGGDASAIE